MFEGIKEFYDLLGEAEGLAEIKYIDFEKINEKTAEKTAILHKVVNNEKISEGEFKLLFSLIPKNADYD